MDPHFYLIEQTDFFRLCGRILITGMVVVPFALPLMLIPWTSSLAILVIFKHLVPSIACGFIAFAFSDWLWIRFHLVTRCKDVAVDVSLPSAKRI